jgi:acetyl esterase/lipase
MNRPFDVIIQRDLEYCSREGARLAGNLFTPKEKAAAPLMVAVHGGGWQGGSAERYSSWGTFLAARGIALFAIKYRLVKEGANRYPASVHDVRAAVQFIRFNAARLQIDPSRIGLMGHSAGGHLSALIGLAGDAGSFSEERRDDAYAGVSTRVKAVVGICGVYDMLAQWQHDLAIRPRDNIAENYLGVSAIDDKFAYFSASPLAYVTPRQNGPAFLITGGTEDDVVDWNTQAKPFATALKQAQFETRLLPVLGAAHFFLYGPLDCVGAHSAFLADETWRFLEEHL